MDPTALWTALGVVGGGVLTVLLAECVRLRGENRRLSAQLTDYLLRLAEADHARREAEQTAKNLQAMEEFRARKGK